MWIRMSGLALLLAASGAAAQNSHCAALPATAQVQARGPDNVINAQLTPRGFTCPRGFTTETVGPVTRCRQPGAVSIESREPRRECYAELQLGSVRGVPVQPRPTAACTASPKIESIVALRGRNIGWADITLTAPPTSAMQITQLRTTGGRTPPAEDPNVQDCFPHNCRLVRIATRAGTPNRVDLTLAAPGNAASTTIPITTEAQCPAR